MIARGAALALLSTTIVVGSCSGSLAVSPTHLSSAQIVAAGSPDLRTLDNTGFVHPSGGTVEVSQGIAPAIAGRGTYLTPPPPTELLPLSRPPVSDRRAERLAQSAASGSDPAEAVGRVALALCDLEAYCDRIGPSGAFESADACSTEERARLGGVVAKAGCETAVRGDLLAECLRAIRAAECDVGADTASIPPTCGQALLSCP